MESTTPASMAIQPLTSLKQGAIIHRYGEGGEPQYMAWKTTITVLTTKRHMSSKPTGICQWIRSALRTSSRIKMQAFHWPIGQAVMPLVTWRMLPASKSRIKWVKRLAIRDGQYYGRMTWWAGKAPTTHRTLTTGPSPESSPSPFSTPL